MQRGVWALASGLVGLVGSCGWFGVQVGDVTVSNRSTCEFGKALSRMKRFSAEESQVVLLYGIN